MATTAVSEWPVDMLKIPVVGYTLPLGPQPTKNALLLPLQDFNVTRARTASYSLPSNLLSQAVAGMSGYAWYARIAATGAQLPSWLSVDRFTGNVSANDATYEGTSPETTFTQVILEKSLLC